MPTDDWRNKNKYFKNPYPGTEEIAPGVYLLQAGNDSEVYFADAKGEIVMWTWTEMTEDPGAWTACLRAMAMGIERLRDLAPVGFPRERKGK